MTEPTLDSVGAWKSKDRWDRTFRISVASIIVLLLLALALMGWMLNNNKQAIDRLSDLADEKGEAVDSLCEEKPDDPTCEKAKSLPDSKEIIEDTSPQVIDLPDPFDDPDPNDPDPFDDPDPDDPEVQQNEVQQEETQEPEIDQPEINDADPDDPEIDNPDPDDPDPNDPDPVDDPDPNDPPNCEGEFVCNAELSEILSGYATQSWVIALFTSLACSVDGPAGQVLTCTITGKPTQ